MASAIARSRRVRSAPNHSVLPTEVLPKLADTLAADAPPLSPVEKQQVADVRARGLSDPLIITQGTIAYLLTFDNGFRLLVPKQRWADHRS